MGVRAAARCRARPDRRPDLGILRELAASGLVVLAEKGYAGAGDHVRIPYRGRGKPASQQGANRAHAQLRSPGERANAQLKTWRILRKLRCCPWRAGQLAKAVHVLQSREIEGCKRFSAGASSVAATRASRSAILKAAAGGLDS